jgi:hypothetical protein
MYRGQRPFWRRLRCRCRSPRAQRRAKKVTAVGEPPTPATETFLLSPRINPHESVDMGQRAGAVSGFLGLVIAGRCRR